MAAAGIDRRAAETEQRREDRGRVGYVRRADTRPGRGAAGTDALSTTATLTSCVLAGQVRTMSVDLLVVTGLTQPDAVWSVERRAGRAAAMRFRRAPEEDAEDEPPGES